MTTITLSTPIPHAGRMVTQITLRPPVMRDYAAIGEPALTTRTADGGYVLVENVEAIAA